MTRRRQLTTDGLEMDFGVNQVGHFLLADSPEQGARTSLYLATAPAAATRPHGSPAIWRA